MVQRRAACFTLNRYRNRSSVSTVIEELGWTSLEERRKHQRLTMLYKIQNGMAAVDDSQYLTLINDITIPRLSLCHNQGQTTTDSLFSQGQSDNGMLFQMQQSPPHHWTRSEGGLSLRRNRTKRPHKPALHLRLKVCFLDFTSYKKKMHCTPQHWQQLSTYWRCSVYHEEEETSSYIPWQEW